MIHMYICKFGFLICLHMYSTNNMFILVQEYHIRVAYTYGGGLCCTTNRAANLMAKRFIVYVDDHFAYS